MKRRILIKSLILAFFLLLALITGISFVKGRNSSDYFHPSSSYSHTVFLSSYLPSLKGTVQDVPIFVFDSGVEGDNVFIMAGTHANESAAILSAISIMENIIVERGKVYVMPVANMSAYRATQPGYAYPATYSLDGEKGSRRFRIGSRLTSQIDQWPDPPFYIQYPSGLSLSAEEARNLNRAYPGRENGSLTERTAFAIMRFLEEEEISYAFDLHEASVSYPVNRTIICREESFDIAYLSSLYLQAKGFDIFAEISSDSNAGYSHYEWGKIEGLHAFLIEVPSPFIDRIPAFMSERLMREGQDDFLYRISELGYMNISYPEEGISIQERTTLHLEAISTVLSVASELNGAGIEITLPSAEMIREKGLSSFLSDDEAGRVYI